MLQFLGNDDTWRTLRSISQHRNGPLYVAVPFLGDGAGKLLHLKRGDVLVVALTITNSRNGSVCPEEIKRLQAKGVKVFSSPRSSCESSAMRAQGGSRLGKSFANVFLCSRRSSHHHDQRERC